MLAKLTSKNQITIPKAGIRFLTREEANALQSELQTRSKTTHDMAARYSHVGAENL